MRIIGVAMGSQERAFRKGVDLVVACPGRLLDHIGSVVNFDVPNQPEDYIHRVGRTARVPTMTRVSWA